MSFKGDDSSNDETEQEPERKEESSGHDKEAFKEKLDFLRFVPEYNSNGLFVGPEPPGKFNNPEIEEDEWCDSWQDKTGEFEYYEPETSQYKFDTGGKYTECECGNTVNMFVTMRQWQCRDCRRWVIDRHWEDERIQNPNTKEQSGLSSFIDG